MNNIKNKRTGLKLLGSVSNGKYRRFTMNKTQQHQPVYSSVQPRCPGIRGNRGAQPCSGSNTKVGCKSCPGCLYTIDVSSNAFNGAFPTYGSFASVYVKVDSSANEPCEWQYNAIVESFSLTTSTSPNTGARIQLNIEDERCINVNSIESVYFYAPVGGTLGVYTGIYRLCDGTPEPSLYPFNNNQAIESKFIKTSKRMGAPYRNPIAGFRKALNCDYKACSKEGDSNTSNWKKQPTNTVYKDNYSGKKGNCSTAADPDDNGCGCCPKNCDSTKIIHRSGIQARTHRPIVRRGMQEITGCCKATVRTLAQRPASVGGGMQYVDIVKCKPKSDYSFSYSQYMKNKRCLSYERSLEKNPGTYSAVTQNKDGRLICQMKYRKSGCAGCCQCCVNRQFFLIAPTNTPPIVNSSFSTAIDGKSTTIGTVDAVWIYPSGFGVVLLLDNGLNDICNGIRNIIQSGQTIINAPANGTGATFGPIGGSTNGFYYPVVYDVENRKGDCGSNKSNTVTIYKPNNKKFSKQGAVSAGSRLERLKLDTVRSANSRCKKGKKCATRPARPGDPFNKCILPPNGKYDAGHPRFTGWMFNGHHQEVKGRVYNMVRYNQQPLGIPQLTQNPAGNTCIKRCFPRQLNLGSNRPTAAGNRARIPGSKCLNSGKCPCSDCNKDSPYTFQGVPCCK